tara:strand:+ start:236 stop:919 length:684 start_codon:yes stop_codon:yes gene_type:complete
LQNTSENQIKTWGNKQEELIASLQLQPLIVVLRPTKEDFLVELTDSFLSKKLEYLNNVGIKHVEIAWTDIDDWVSLIKKLKQKFPNISLGAASITNDIAFKDFQESGLCYAMTPIWNKALQKKARISEQILIPGVLTPSEIQNAISFGWKIIKIFPASTLGLNYIKQIKTPIKSLPFVIAAGGIKSQDIDQWLNAGYNAVAIGRELKDIEGPENKLTYWLKKNNTTI